MVEKTKCCNRLHRKQGLNEHGLAVAMTFVMTSLDKMLMCHKVTQKATDSRHNSVKIDA